jgi:hypothetical protein
MFTSKSLIVSAFVLFSFISGCHRKTNESDPTVAFGTPLNMGSAELQYSVLVLGGQFGCSGVAVGPRHVITAATCVGRFEDLRTDPRFILESKIEIISLAGQRPESIRAVSAVRHPYFKVAVGVNPLSATEMVSTDIALVVLEKPMQTNGVKIALPEQKLSAPLKLTGFGSDENEFTNGRPRTAVSQPGWSGAKLDNGYGIVGFVKGDGVPCDGDGGAPAVSDGHLVGTVSMVRRNGINICRSTESSTLTDVRMLRGWLKCSAGQMKFPLAQVNNANADRWCEKNEILHYKL